MAGRSFEIFLAGDAKNESRLRTRAEVKPASTELTEQQKDSIARVRPHVIHKTSVTTPYQGPLMQDGYFTTPQAHEIQKMQEAVSDRAGTMRNNTSGTVSGLGGEYVEDEDAGFGIVKHTPESLQENVVKPAARRRAKSGAVGAPVSNERIYDLNNPSDFSDYFENVAASKKKSRADKELISLANSAPKAAEPDPETLVKNPKISAHEAWNSLKAIHGMLKQHYEGRSVILQSRAAQYRNTANNISQVSPGHEAIQPLLNGASALEEGARKPSSLGDRMQIGNKLVEAQSLLHSLKELDNTGHLTPRFRTDLGSDVLHSQIKEAHRVLMGISKKLDENDYQNYGVGSPVHIENMKHLGSRIDEHLITKKETEIPVEHVERDIDEITGAVAKPGHVWVGTRDSGGNLEQLEATPENLAMLRDMYGGSALSVQRMQGMLRKTRAARKQGGVGEAVETREVRPGVVPLIAAGKGGHVKVGDVTTTGGKTRSRAGGGASRRSAEAFEASDVTRKNRERTKAAAKSGVLPSEVKAQDEEAKTTANKELFNQALGHVRAGRRIPKELRAQMHPTVVAAVLKQARDEKKEQ